MLGLSTLKTMYESVKYLFGNFKYNLSSRITGHKEKEKESNEEENKEE